MNDRMGGTVGLPGSVSSRAMDQPGTAGRAGSGTRRMNDRPAAILFAPRSVVNCLDLAVMYIGRQLPMILVLWLCAAVPSCALVYVLSYYHGFDLRMTLAVIYVTTLVLGSWLIAAMTPSVFDHMVGEDRPAEGEGRRRSPLAAELLNLTAVTLSGVLLALILAPESALAIIGDELRLVVVILLGLVLFARASVFIREQSDRHVGVSRSLLAVLPVRALMSIGPALCLFSDNGWLIFLGVILTFFLGTPLAIRFGFLAERACLQQFNRRLHHRGSDRLLKSGMGDLFIRGCVIAVFSGMLWFVLFLTADIMSSLLFQVPILTGRLGKMDLDSERFWVFLTSDPLLMTVLTATALAVYIIGRLAWFLCYIDVRVRQDCWDVELNLIREAARLRNAV